MESFLNKISEYNLFNYLLPGFVFIYLVDKQYGFVLLHEQIVVSLFIAYFIGMVISRIGSIVIEKAFKCLRIVEYADYKDYLAAEEKDEKLKTLVQENNTYRTFTALFFILNFILLVLYLENGFERVLDVYDYVSFFMLVLFSLAYRKQTDYIRKRVARVLSDA